MVKQFDKVQDSGKRQQFKTGSQRDTDEGKGNPSLVAWEVFLKMQEYKNSEIYPTNDLQGMTTLGKIETLLWRYSIPTYTREENDLIMLRILDLACLLICEDEGKINYAYAYRRIARHYQNGAKKYDKNNWRKGQAVSRYYDSIMRHLWKIQEGLKDEDHYSALAWNVIGIIQTKIDVEKEILPKELDDFPFLISEIKGETTK